MIVIGVPCIRISTMLSLQYSRQQSSIPIQEFLCGIYCCCCSLLSRGFEPRSASETTARVYALNQPPAAAAASNYSEWVPARNFLFPRLLVCFCLPGFTSPTVYKRRNNLSSMVFVSFHSEGASVLRAFYWSGSCYIMQPQIRRYVFQLGYSVKKKCLLLKTLRDLH